MNILFRCDPSGKLRYWEILKQDENKLVTSWGVLGGESTSHTEEIKTNSSGRSIKEQIHLEIESRVKKKRDAGYKDSMKEAKESPHTNSLNLPRPMLAVKYAGRIVGPAWVQYKYDGHRCLIHNNGDRLIAYSRNGVEIPTIGHILERINIPEGATLDGELYVHGKPLQTITSLVRRKQPGTEDLQYVVFDQIADKPFHERYTGLLSLSGCVKLAPTWGYAPENLTSELSLAIEQGFEGLIVRLDDKPYSPGKRCKQTMKVKLWQDDYFTIQGVKPSSDGWAVLDCGTFHVTAPGSVGEKINVYNNRDKYIGKKVRVEYAYLTKEGIPFHPVATLIE